MTLIGFQYEPISLDVNEICFEEEQNPNTHEKSRKTQSVREWCRCGKSGAMHTNVGYLFVGKFKLWDTLTAGLFNLNTCTNLRTRYRVLEADLRLLPLLR